MGLVFFEYAVIKDDTGRILKKIRINKTAQNVLYGEKAYKIDRLNGFNLLLKGWIIDKKFFFYNIKTTDPLALKDDKLDVLLDPEIYNTFLKSHVLVKLNQEASGKGNGLLAFLSNMSTSQLILGAMTILAVGYYLFNGTIL